MMEEVLGEVADRMVANMGALGYGEVPSFALGESELAEMGAPPRIVWVPQTGTVSRSKTAGGDFIRNPGALWSRALVIEAHIWAAGITAAEELANHLVATLHAVCVGSYSVRAESWDTKGATDDGVSCIIEFEIRMPFTRERVGSVRAETVAITPDMEA